MTGSDTGGTGRPPEFKLTRPSDVAVLLQAHGIRPNKVLGQNFLIDQNILGIILDAAELSPGDVVLEIGPGLGVLTGPLLARAGRVVAVEKDQALYRLLCGRFAGETRLDLMHADIMDVPLPGLLARGVTKVVANLPYSVGTRILVDLFEQPVAPRQYVVTVQKEVADRLAAKPGSDDYGLLALLAQLDHDVRVHKVVSPGCFFPPPQIKSAVVVIRRLPRPRVEIADRRRFKALIKHAFSQRRKQIATILHGFTADPRDALGAVGLDPRERPENIPLSVWGALANRLS